MGKKLLIMEFFFNFYFTSQEARSVCLGRNEPRVPWRLCGKHTGSAAAEPPFSPAKHLFIFKIGVKRPVGVALPPLSWGRGGDGGWGHTHFAPTKRKGGKVHTEMCLTPSSLPHKK